MRNVRQYFRPLGLNRRNHHIGQTNPRRSVAEVKDKLITKQRLSDAGVSVAPTLGVIGSAHAARSWDWAGLPESFVMKPARGSRGRGVVVVTGAEGDRYQTPDGILTTRKLVDHVVAIVDGEHSDTETDVAIIEPLLVSHSDLARLSPVGLPDVRVICDHDVPLMAMLRIPTTQSGGRGNLHQGGLGAALDLATGRITRGQLDGKDVERHPDTGAVLRDFAVPNWQQMLNLAARCGSATGLGYCGADLIADAHLGPIVLEVNSHPGLEIQNICRAPLDPRRATRTDA